MSSDDTALPIVSTIFLDGRLMGILVSYAGLDEQCQTGAVSCLEAGARCLNYLGGCGEAPINLKARRKRQLANEFPLGPAVALAEWMNRVDFTQIERRAESKRLQI